MFRPAGVAAVINTQNWAETQQQGYALSLLCSFVGYSVKVDEGVCRLLVCRTKLLGIV